MATLEWHTHCLHILNPTPYPIAINESEASNGTLHKFICNEWFAIDDYPLVYVALTELSFQISQGGASRIVTRRSNHVDVLSYTKLLLPFHLPGHWVLIIIHPQLDRILVQGLNSGGDSLKEHAKVFFDWIILEGLKKGIALDYSNFYYQDFDVPQQDDAVNCGVHMLNNMLKTLDNMLLDADKCTMNHHRAKWSADLLRGRIDHLISPGSVDLSGSGNESET
jgi:hypothetical protein